MRGGSPMPSLVRKACSVSPAKRRRRGWSGRTDPIGLPLLRIVPRRRALPDPRTLICYSSALRGPVKPNRPSAAPAPGGPPARDILLTPFTDAPIVRVLFQRRGVLAMARWILFATAFALTG